MLEPSDTLETRSIKRMQILSSAKVTRNSQPWHDAAVGMVARHCEYLDNWLGMVWSKHRVCGVVLGGHGPESQRRSQIHQQTLYALQVCHRHNRERVALAPSIRITLSLRAVAGLRRAVARCAHVPGLFYSRQ